MVFQRFIQIIEIIRFTPFDCSTETGRSKERYRRVVMTAIASAFAKGISIITVLISVPLTLNYLGTERYGLWMTISSIIAMLGFADLGLGNGLLNVISDAKGRGNKAAAGSGVSSTFFMLSGISVILSLFFVLAYSFLDWKNVYNLTSSTAIAEAGPATALFAVCFILNLPLGIVQRIQLGYQEGFNNGIWTALGSLLGLLLVLLTIYLKAGLPWLVLSMSGSAVFTSCLNMIFLFYKRPYLIPRLKNVNYTVGLKILKTGLLFFILQLAVAVAFTSDNIVAAQILGPEAVAEYSVPFKMFSIVSMVVGMLLNPLWPAYGESIARGDIAWVKSTLYKSMKLSLLVTIPGCIILTVFGLPILHLWAGSQMNPSSLLLIGLAVWTVISTCGNALAMFLNGADLIGFQVVSAVIMSVSALILKIMLAKTFGISGIIFGVVIAYIIFTIIPFIIVTPGILAKLNKRFERSFKVKMI